MTASLISISTFLLLLVGSGSTTSPAVPKGPWSLDYKTSGGFAGVGKGSIAVDSNGKFACSSNDRGQAVKGATGTLTPPQLQPIGNAVGKLDRRGWNIPGLNVAAPDAFGYKLEFRTGADLKELTSVQWYDNTADKLPDDLRRLRDVLEQIMKARCAGRS